MKKRTLFMLSALLLAGLVPLMAGGKKETPAPSGGGTGKYAKRLTISTTVLDAEKTGKSAKDKWLFDKFNIDYNLIAVTWGDWNEKTRAMIAGDDIPDVLWWDMKLNHTAEFKVWAEAGAFREIAQADIEKRPNLKALRNRLVSDDQILTVNGKLYGWPVARALICRAPSTCTTSTAGIGQRRWARPSTTSLAVSRLKARNLNARFWLPVKTWTPCWIAGCGKWNPAGNPLPMS
jgi:ABC-type glycerol-3-phosphate transport system substrate-binding protein